MRHHEKFSPNTLLFTDSYKLSHRTMYPEKTSLVYSNFTPRSSRIPGLNYMVNFGTQYLIKRYLLNEFNDNFFLRKLDDVLDEYKETTDAHFMTDYDVSHIRELHNLGYLPLKIKALPEGTKVPLQTPTMTFWNTKPEFFWLTNYLETLISNTIWKPCTSATTASIAKGILLDYAKLTSPDNLDFVDFQGHDFSFRGMSGVDDALSSSAAHLLYFKGTDTVPSLNWIKHYYNGDIKNLGYSVPASEHSVMCAGLDCEEFSTIDRIIFDLFPEGIVSVVCDTWDYFKVLTEYLPSRKEKILARNGKLVCRPDSGQPDLIINGDPNSSSEVEKKGTLRLMQEVFGGQVNRAGYFDLDTHIGYIYGDGINTESLKTILGNSMANGFSSTNGVYGLGSYTYNFTTRDVLGLVCKGTYARIDGVGRNLFKSPKTGGWKKSHKGLLRVNPDLSVTQEVDWENEGGELRTVFEDGELIIDEDFSTIRNRANRHDN